MKLVCVREHERCIVLPVKFILYNPGAALRSAAKSVELNLIARHNGTFCRQSQEGSHVLERKQFVDGLQSVTAIDDRTH